MRRSRFMITTWVILALTLAIATGVQFTGCSESEEGEVKPNQPPRVWLSSAPPEGSTEKYTIQMFWGGWDPDGEIAYFEYAITDNEDGPFDPADTTGADKWNKVFGNDSMFTFTADELADTNTIDMVTEFIRSHTFFIRAVDRQGLASIEPAYRSFTARTLSPSIVVSIPPGGSLTPAFVPPITNFRWRAEDYIDDLVSTMEPESVSWILEPTSKHNQSYDETRQYISRLPVDSPEWNKHGGWKWYGAPEDSGRFWTTPPLDFQPYLFAVRAKDEAGAITPVFDERFNVRRIQVSERSTGPVFRVRNVYMGSVTTAICHEPVTILDLPAGVPADFCWDASADHYGGIVAGYRYGWDIEDLSNPDQWEIDYTPFTTDQACAPSRTFYFGTHVFTAEVIDNSGYCSRIEIKVNIIQFTMENNLLVVDDYAESGHIGWDDPSAYGVSPNDDQHDQFWADVLQNVAGFNPSGDILELDVGDEIPLTEIAKYRSLIWSVYGHVDQPTQAVLYDYIQYRSQTGGGGGGRRRPNIVALYLAAGGHLLICGNHPGALTINHSVTLGAFRYPIIFLYELGGNQTQIPNAGTERVGLESFAYRELCLETMEFGWTTYIRRRDPTLQGNCPNYLVRRIPPGARKNHTMRSAIPIDSTFPVLELREEAAGVGRQFHESIMGWDAEVYNPGYFFNICGTLPRGPRSCFQPIYGLGCLDTAEPTYGTPVAFWTSAFADRVADAQGAIAARSAVFGFPPVYFKPDQVRGAIEAIVFDEWQLPRKN